MAHVLVTGGGGFIGLAVCRALAARGDRVTAFDMAISPGLAALAAANARVRAVQGELLEWPAIAGLFAADKPDAVIHCAAVVGVLASARAPMMTMRVNVEGALTLLEAMRLHGVRRMVHVSSEETYNLGSGAAPSLGEIAAIVRALVPGADITVGPGPYDHGIAAELNVPSVPKGALDITRAGAVLGYRPRFDIRRGLADTVARLQH